MIFFSLLSKDHIKYIFQVIINGKGLWAKDLREKRLVPLGPRSDYKLGSPNLIKL